jgi:tetratricopeptide (TPR) repeat protein
LIRHSLVTRCLAIALALHGGLLCVSPRVLAVSPKSKSAEADAIAEEAKRRFRQGDFAIAARLFVRAQELDPRPDRVYNIARCEEKLKHYEEAARLMQQYIDSTQDVAGREEARIRLAEIQRQAAEEQAAARQVEHKAALEKAAADKQAADRAAVEKAQADQAAADRANRPVDMPRAATPVVIGPPAPPAGHVPTATWATLGVGGGVAVTGLALYLAGVAADSSLQGRVDTQRGGYVTGTTQASASSDQTGNAHLRTAGAVVGLAGVAILGFGTWLWWQDGQATVSVGPNGLAIAGRF